VGAFVQAEGIYNMHDEGRIHYLLGPTLSLAHISQRGSGEVKR